MTDLPHFTYPFQWGSPYATVTEQDSLDEIADCVVTVMLYPLGYRPELPEFGMPDLTFAQAPIDEDQLREVIEQWEPRAAVLLDQELDDWDELVTRIEARINVRTEN